MTWRDIFARLLLLLRSRLSRHRTCGECGWLLEYACTGVTVYGSLFYEWRCGDCEEVKRLEKQEKAREAIRQKEWELAKEREYETRRQQKRILLEARALAGYGPCVLHGAP